MTSNTPSRAARVLVGLSRRMAIAVLLATAPSAAWAGFGPAGPEFQVNTYTASGQETNFRGRSVAIDDSGNSVITWMSYFQDGSGWGIYAQRLNAAGVAQG